MSKLDYQDGWWAGIMFMQICWILEAGGPVYLKVLGVVIASIFFFGHFRRWNKAKKDD